MPSGRDGIHMDDGPIQHVDGIHGPKWSLEGIGSSIHFGCNLASKAPRWSTSSVVCLSKIMSSNPHYTHWAKWVLLTKM